MNKRISVALSNSDWLKLQIISEREDTPGGEVLRQLFRQHISGIDENFQTKSKSPAGANGEARGKS